MAFDLLGADRIGAKQLAEALENAATQLRHCENCRMFTEEKICQLCSNQRRDSSILCVVETPADVFAIEQTGVYSGRYFVLMGHISPIDGIGPGELGLELLDERLAAGGIAEVILATGVTVEGDATAHVIASMTKKKSIQASRIAYGVPVGGELEFVDSGTLARALVGRREMD